MKFIILYFIYKLRIYTLLIKKKYKTFFDLTWHLHVKFYTTYSITYKCFICIKNISLYKSFVICTYSYTQIFEWDNNCVVHLKAFYSSPMWDWLAVYFFLPDAFLFSSIRNMNSQNILHIDNTRHLAKECHQVSKLYKCTKCNSNDRNQHSGTKYYSSNSAILDHFFANMHRYETMSCFSNISS